MNSLGYDQNLLPSAMSFSSSYLFFGGSYQLITWSQFQAMPLWRHHSVLTAHTLYQVRIIASIHLRSLVMWSLGLQYSGCSKLFRVVSRVWWWQCLCLECPKWQGTVSLYDLLYVPILDLVHSICHGILFCQMLLASHKSWSITSTLLLLYFSFTIWSQLMGSSLLCRCILRLHAGQVPTLSHLW